MQPVRPSVRPANLTAVAVDVVPRADGFSWALTNHGRTAQRVDAARVEIDLGPLADPVRVFRNGYQSWSPTG